MHTVKSAEHPDGDLELEADGMGRIRQLQVLLLGAEKNCIRIIGDVFDDAFFDSHAPVDMADSLIKSPVLQHFTFSPTVLALVNRMMPVIAPESSPYPLEEYFQAPQRPPRTSHWKHILVLHLRRGDGWEEACNQKGVEAK